jgi:hypothetical protein
MPVLFGMSGKDGKDVAAVARTEWNEWTSIDNLDSQASDIMERDWATLVQRAEELILAVLGAGESCE